MPKKKKAACTKSDNKDGSPFSRLEVYKELRTINERVEKILANYEEFGPPTQLYITDEQVDHVKKLIEKFDNIRLEKETALKTVNKFYKSHLRRTMEVASMEFSGTDMELDMDLDKGLPEELLKDIKHHEFQHAYDEALKGLDKLKTLITSTANLANSQLSKRPPRSYSPQKNQDNCQDDMARSPVSKEQNSGAHISLQNARLLRDFSKQKRDLESTKQAYNKLLQEKTNLMTIVGEVDRLKKELNEANKEVEFLHKLVDKKKTMDSATNKTRTDQPQLAKLNDDQDDKFSYSTHSSILPPIVTTTEKDVDIKEEHRQNSVFNKSASKKHTFTVGRRALNNKKQEVVNPITASAHNNKKDTNATFTKAKFPDINQRRPSIIHTPTDPVVKLPEIQLKNIPSISVETAGHSRKPNNNKPQLISSEKIVETLLDLHAKHELSPRHLEKDHTNILNALIKEPVDNFNKPDQFDKAAQAIVEYTNMGQTIKEVDHIVNEQCKQESREYQWIIDKEEESKNAIIEHYSEFVESIDSAVDFVNKQLQRDGIIGSGQIYGTSTDHPVTFSQITKETEGTYQDFIGKIAEALTTISTSSALYLQHVNLSMIEQQKRLMVLKRANPQVYEKCIKQLDKDSQYPELISKRLHEGLGIMNGILERHIAEMQSEIDVFMSEREKLVEKAKLQMQAHIAEITQIAGNVFTLLALDEKETTSNLSTGLQTSLVHLNRLCGNQVQVIKEYKNRENTGMKQTAPLSETVKPVLKEVQSKVKDLLCKGLSLRMPHQLDYKLIRKPNSDVPQTTFPLLPRSSHSRSMHVSTLELTSRDASIDKTSTSTGRNNRFQSSLMWDQFIQPSSAEDGSLSILNQGIQGKTIGKRNRVQNGHFTPLKDMKNTSDTKDIGSLKIEGRGKKSCKRRMHPQRMSITITVKNRLIRDENPPKEPVECFKVTSLKCKDQYT